MNSFNQVLKGGSSRGEYMNENCENTNERVFKILIVEDEKEIQDALKLTLTNAWEFNSEISTTENCETALTEIEQQNYDLVLAA
ncbi:hypothetical protein KA005_57710, partial [bacterium]|nr:hypothetical protein [bacterium]